jgi:amidophosphoribosyltransferase
MHACALGPEKLTGPPIFEVGVFCGKYCSPVDDGYLQHLEEMRGEVKKRKALNDARDAVATGVANETQRQLVDLGGRLRGHEVVPITPMPMPNGRDAPDYLHASPPDQTSVLGTFAQ